MLLNRCLCCLNILDKNHSRLVDATLLEILEVLFEKSNVKVEISSRICYACEEKLKIAFKFKGLCIYTEDRLHPYIPGYVQNNKKIDLKEIYAKENQCNEPNTGYICRLCLQLVDECDKHLLLNVLEEKNVKDTFKIYLPEVNLNSTEDPTICEPCRQSLINFLEFIGSSRPINNAVKVEPAENFQELYIKLEPLDIVSVKEENDSEKPGKEAVLKKFEKVSGLYICELCSKKCKTIQNMVKHMHSHLDLWYKCKLCSYKAKYKKHLENHEVNHVKGGMELKIYKCDECEYRAKYKYMIKNHKQIHSDEIFTCNLCNFQNGNKMSMRLHVSRHSNKKIYKCDICPHETVDIAYLRRHKKRRHPDLTKIKKRKCSLCTYETDVTDDFNRHMLIHKNKSEVELYKCYNCGLETKHKYYLLHHIRTFHMPIPDENLYKCKHCDFVTKHKNSYKSHMDTQHQDESKLVFHKCPKCSYKTKNIVCMKGHMIMIHSKVPLHSCKQCDFKTKYLTIFKNHVRIIHNNGADLQLHQCQMCSFYTVYRENLVRHMAIHTKNKKDKFYKCQLCDHSCRVPSDLKKHTRLHHSSNIKILKCESCTFSTKYSTSMHSHMKRHKKMSEVDTYKCAKCSYKTITKGSLIIHMLIHKSTSEVRMYKCPDCSYQTVYKNNLPKHRVIHNDNKEFACKQCDYKAKRKTCLKHHQLRLHGGITSTN